MIKTGVQGQYDTIMEFSDWRYSAAALGILRYFEYHGYKEGSDYKIGLSADDSENEFPYDREDVLLYNREIIDFENNMEKYLEFAEEYFSSKMHNLKIQKILGNYDIDKDQVKEINECMKANTVMKKIFKNIKYPDNTKEEIAALLEKNRYEIIKETYKNGKATYSNFANPLLLGNDEGEVCRLKGYYIDLGKKKKSVGFNWDYSTYVYDDCPEFDFIPFAFSNTREAFFINNNFSLNELKKANNALNNILKNNSIDKDVNNDYINLRKHLFLSSINTAQFVDYQVEIIVKNRKKEYFETMFVRKPSIEVYNMIISKYINGNYDKTGKDLGKIFLDNITKPCRYGKKDYIDILTEITDYINGLIHIDPLIDKLSRDIKENRHKSLIMSLIYINSIIYVRKSIIDNKLKNNFEKEVEKMSKKINIAVATARNVVNKFKQQENGGKDKKNKIRSYRNKLISCLTFKDYDRFKTILLQFSAYCEIPFSFAYDLFEDFEANKNIAYAFVNALDISEGYKENKEKEDNK